jgi:hypothetical protein
MRNLTLPKDEKELAEFQNTIDEMINSFNEYKKETAVLSTKLDDALGTLAAKQIALDNLMTTIKNIHITLNTDNPVQIDEMRKELAKFIISNEAIRSGVRQNAIN